MAGTYSPALVRGGVEQPWSWLQPCSAVLAPLPSSPFAGAQRGPRTTLFWGTGTRGWEGGTGPPEKYWQGPPSAAFAAACLSTLLPSLPYLRAIRSLRRSSHPGAWRGQSGYQSSLQRLTIGLEAGYPWHRHTHMAPGPVSIRGPEVPPAQCRPVRNAGTYFHFPDPGQGRKARPRAALCTAQESPGRAPCALPRSPRSFSHGRWGCFPSPGCSICPVRREEGMCLLSPRFPSGSCPADWPESVTLLFKECVCAVAVY